MNVYDSEKMADTLSPLGFRLSDTPDEADVVIVNTCHIREKAAEKTFSELGRLNLIKQKRQSEGKDCILAVAGCVAQAEGEEIQRRAPYVDIVFGPQTYHRLPEMVAAATERHAGRPQRILDTDFPLEAKFDFLPARSRNVEPTAFLTVQEGCDKFCTFCVVPYTRGAEYSRPVQSIVDEAAQLVSAGAVELTLLGQNVNAYHGLDGAGATVSLAALISRLSRLEGLSRIRYTTSHPNDMTDDLMELHRDCEALMPYLHLPVQSGSDSVLQRMNRRYTAADYRAIIRRLRQLRPDIALSGDFIVGFPGETDADFAETMALVEDVTYAQAYSFKYSPRPGTPGAQLTEAVPAEVADRRLQALQSLLNHQQQQFNRQSIGKTLPVLFDRPGKKPGQLLGRSPYNQAVVAEGDMGYIGRMHDVHIEGAYANSLHGRMTKGSETVAA